MKIAVNTRLLQKGKLDGIGWFSYESLLRLTQSHPEVEFVFVFDRPFDTSFIFGDNVRAVSLFPPTRHPLLYIIWFEFSLFWFLRKEKPDLFLSPDGYLSLLTKVPSLPVIHDINFLHRPQDLPFAYRKYYNWFFPRFARKAVRIATVSSYSKNDIATSYQIDTSKIDVLYNGANTMYEPIDEAKKMETRIKYSGGSKYFVFIGMLHPRKNISQLIKAFDLYRKKVSDNEKLLIIGEKMFMAKEIDETLAKIECTNDIVFLGRLVPEDLKNVLGSAAALVFVPLFEGFGIPVVEAMYCDVPVICSNVTSLPEVAGNAALFVDPHSTEEIADAMLQIMNDDKLREHLIEKGRIQRQQFTWDKTAQRLWECIQKAIQ